MTLALQKGIINNMDKKITIKDIAREAGVSIATVSYVLNNREEKHISEETTKKVLQVVNMFNYTCSFSARHISTGKTNIVALYVNDSDFPLCNADKHVFALRLLGELSKEGFSLRIVERTQTERLNNVDAIICCDTPTEFFRLVGNNNFVPLLSYDNFVNDSLFYQINTDYAKAKQFAEGQLGCDDFAVATLSVGNAERRKEMLKAFDEVLFVDSFDSLHEVAREFAEKPLLVFEQCLFDALSRSCKKLCIYDPWESKICALVQKMKEVINRQDVDGFSLKF